MKTFYTPEGYAQGLPKVEVCTDLPSSLGTAVVNYDGLDELFHRDLGLPDHINPLIRLQKIRQNYAGYYGLLSGILKIDPVKAERFLGSDALTALLLHESRHLADYVNRPVRTYGETVLRIGTNIGIGAFAAKYSIENTDIPNIISGYLGYIVGANTSQKIIYRFSPIERRANQAERDWELLNKYRGVIKFDSKGTVKDFWSRVGTQRPGSTPTP